ncbi:hypothetical protein BOTBODRAFT_37189 [Botryobasidium botryosum FD-172 SS1]|uniref:Uncharacterized protein n=1 Tax=Botryobasidium botryosum (strain FD-172 SS1) TaxID=930990 RepID=A0A067M3J7_BOTB1|nr:hypothetical protein BOTBODRAFT_37189 [Botryobasidium botryosum FD-172 SS1]
MGLEDKSLQDCVKILSCWVNLEECEESADIRDTDVISRIYSPSTPAYIDLHFTYHYRQRAFAGNNEWHYAVGYKLHSSPSGNLPDPAALEKEVPPSGMAPKKMHQQHGWEPLCFGESKSSGVPPKKEDVAGLYEILFGPLPEPPKRSSEALKVEQKRRLVRTIRVLLAAVGIDYRIAVEKGEKDVPPGRKGDGIHWKLDAKSDKQFAKRARKACGFQLPTK